MVHKERERVVHALPLWQPATDVACFFLFPFSSSIKDELLFKLHEDEVPRGERGNYRAGLDVWA